MDLSIRLSSIANTVKYSSLADIGTDHAYIPTYLFHKGIIAKCAACDIHTGPLQRAAENINFHRLQGKIELRLGSGLEPVMPYEFHSVVIAGMGGMLIMEILKNSMPCAKSFKQIILQPQQHISDVRRFLIQNQFVITGEEMVLDERKYYTILEAASSDSENSDEYNEMDIMLGKIENHKNKKLLKDFIVTELDKTNGILRDIRTKGSSGLETGHRTAKLEGLTKLYNEVLKCI